MAPRKGLDAHQRDARMLLALAEDDRVPARDRGMPAGTVILTDQDMALTLQVRMDSLEADLADEGAGDE